MKLPGVAIATSFGCGIVIGLVPSVSQHAGARWFLAGGLLLSILLLLSGISFAYFQKLFWAGAISLACWAVLGVVAAGMEQQPRAGDHVLALAEAGKIDLKSPLRWYGRMRDEPSRLPWGWGYEIALSGVDAEGSFVPLRGGLRFSFTAQPGKTVPVDLHIGDEVAVLAQAKLPQVYRDEGAFDRREYLARQEVHVTGILRSAELLERVSAAKPSIKFWPARARRRLREEIATLFAGNPQAAGILRAMLLGDRNFVDAEESTAFQKTGAFHVLAVAGLHVGAIAAVLFWMGRKLRLRAEVKIFLTLGALAIYVLVVQERPPVLRAALMAAIVVLGGFFFRRVEALNSAAMAALILLVARPLVIRDSSFQLSFLAIGCIAGLAIPWLHGTSEPYVRALRGWRDVTRDAGHAPKHAQFRIDLRWLMREIGARVPKGLARSAENCFVGGCAAGLRAWELLVVTLVLQIGMLPLMARDFHRIALAAPIVNLAAVPLTGIIVPLGFATLISGLVFPGGAEVLAWPLSRLTIYLAHFVTCWASFPRWNYRIPGPPLWIICAFFVALLGLGILFRVQFAGKRILAVAAAALLAITGAVIATYPFAARWSRGNLEMTTLDVGQGDSLLVVSPQGKTLLIDGGGAFGGFPGHEQQRGSDPGEEAVSPYLWQRGIKRIDAIALTHAHQDHLGGLLAVLDNFRVGQLWIGREVGAKALLHLEDVAREKNIPVIHESRGEKFLWDGVAGDFLWPEVASEGVVTAAGKNNDSLVLRLRFGRVTLLLPGDAEKQAEGTILGENDAEEMRADVLKVGHHGSKNSTMPDFLAAVRPSVAIISAGSDNPYGHPSAELLARLNGAGVRVLRTDRDGAVQVLTDGKELRIRCFISCPEAANLSVSHRAENPDSRQNNHEQ